MTNIKLITDELEKHGFEYDINLKKTVISTRASLLDIYKIFCDKVIIEYNDSNTLLLNNDIKINNIV